jgi:hypothetical protein
MRVEQQILELEQLGLTPAANRRSSACLPVSDDPGATLRIVGARTRAGADVVDLQADAQVTVRLDRCLSWRNELEFLVRGHSGTLRVW